MSSCVSFKTEEIFDNGIMGQTGGDLLNWEDCSCWAWSWCCLFMILAIVLGYFLYKTNYPTLPATQEQKV
jgi:hypothetical protein